MTTLQPDPQSDSRDGPVDNPSAASSEPSPSHTDGRDRSPNSEGVRPPLPPRPNTLNLLDDETASRANLQAEATTAVSRADIGTQSPDAGSAHSTLAARGMPRGLKARTSLSQLASPKGSEAGDSASIRSSIQNGDVGDVEALFKDFVTTAPGGHSDAASLLHFPEFPADDVDDDGFLSEFEPVGELNEEAGNEGRVFPSCVVFCLGI